MRDNSASAPVIELAAHGHRLGVTPLGAGLTHWRWQPPGSSATVDLLRPAPPGAGGDPLALGCFPLVPYSNRISHGRFSFQGRQVSLPRNFGSHPHSIHGHGWQSLWQLAGQGPASLELRLDRPADAWPYAYQAGLTAALGPDGLALTLSLRNTGPAPMPAGLGLHPYFPAAPSARLKAGVTGVWLTDETRLPVRHVALPDSWDLPGGCAVAGMACDNVFTGWDGHARIDWAGAGLALELIADPPLRHLVVYAPPGEAFFCVEPVSHVTDAFNRAAAGEGDTGMLVLAPGEARAATVRFRPRRL